MKTLPIVLNNKKILLIGNGVVAEHKASVLKRNEIEFKTVVTKFKITDLEDYEIVVDATGSKEVSDLLIAYKKKFNLLLNVVDKPELCDFYFASLLEYGNFKVAVSSAGSSPTATQIIRDRIKKIMPKNIEEFCDKAMSDRKAGVIDLPETKKALAQVYLVGCGLGDVELLTIKAYNIIQRADVVFIDHLISQEIIEIIPSECERVMVGKQKGFHSIKQDEINKLLVEYALKGKVIARLKSGDPYIFGRGSEEAIALVNEGIKVEVIPGISSAIAGCATAGIAPTARGYATNMSIVSAHFKGNSVNLEWVDLLKMPNHTTVVLMGVSRAKEILSRATELEVQMSTKVAIISNASRENQSTRVGTLKELVELCSGVDRPAILVFGEVVELQKILPNMENNYE
ncbi:MAG: uroporphyrinogen-III C-methyltransferase [Helicobacteraceae bacterium]|nr:uroporphyrinogen-III C-methyltransferase [Helicobacteraceae bacterium]